MNGDGRSSRGDDSFKTSQDYVPLGYADGESRGHSHGHRHDHRDRDRDRDRDYDRDRDRRRERDRGSHRHRSRSPHRARESDFDPYSASRFQRERQRMDRYHDRDGRSDPRGDGRDPRDGRDDRYASSRRYDDRPPRREHDSYDRPPRRGRDEHERPPRQPRPRSATPPRKKKEPTPDLTDTISILERPRRRTQWDIRPQGYENITAEQAKLSGMFPLPGNPRQQAVDPGRLQALMNQPAGTNQSTALKTVNARQSKRLFVRSFPASMTGQDMIDFFNLQMNGLNVVSAADPCTNALVSPDSVVMMIEFRTPSDATVGLALDGILVGDGTDGEVGIQVRRPRDYIVPPASAESETRSGQGPSSTVPDSPNKISITGVPDGVSEEQLLELLGSFGELKAFAAARDTGSEQFRGFAFAEYADPGQTNGAIETLNGMDLGGVTIKVQRASIGEIQAQGVDDRGVNAMLMLAGAQSTDLEQSRVIQLLNMTTIDELMDNRGYEELREDVVDECEKYGKIIDLKIPRPQAGARQGPGIGKIYLKYDTVEAADTAMKALAGRKFADRTVLVSFFGEEYFDVGAW